MDEARIDRWLWAARFFKTRALAKKAVETGRVRLNDSRTKPSKNLVVGDHLLIRRGDDSADVEVKALHIKRASAKIAQTWYEETPESIAAREEKQYQRQIEKMAAPDMGGRPDKRARRKLTDLKRS